ncbi:Facilitated trehalose transporter Tret1-2 homolog-like Protein [Tribolium castaneum]|uniref:Facilitated trehalose transporter Tret1-2 homolog-like Protein n=1 Tax=Tribolium castaneum TaxID=7070 RepID=D6WKJ6_TRICA|nr:Facilitated trehalose transporter Tret1-2 homolog-like Protein [Tribolium castaneum]
MESQRTMEPTEDENQDYEGSDDGSDVVKFKKLWSFGFFKNSLFRQIWVTVAVSWLSRATGYIGGYTSPAGISLKEDLQITEMQFSWISGFMPLAALFGSFLGGFLIDRCGRRLTLLISDILFLVSWILNFFAQEYWHLYISRSISGCGVGIASLTLPIYLGEILQPKYRGMLGLLPTTFGNIGILICFSMGIVFEWKGIAGIGALLTVSFLLAYWFIPETPHWYFMKKRPIMSSKALAWLQGNSEQDAFKKEAEELLTLKETSNEEENNLTDLFRKPYLTPLLIVLGLMFCQQFSGINVVIYYSTQIFDDTGSHLDPTIQTIIVGAVNFASTFIAAIFIDKLGRKVLLYISSVAMIMSLAVLGTYFYLMTVQKMDLSDYSWIPLANFIVYVLGFSFGFGPVPWLMMGEILPVKVRGPAASLATGFNWTCTFIVTTTFPLFKDVVGEHGAFWLFCAVCVVGLAFTILFVPETKGYSLEDIERILRGEEVRRRSSMSSLGNLNSSSC